MRQFFILCCLIIVTNGLSAQSAREKIVSPDKKIAFVISLDQGKLYYRVSYNNKPVINLSALELIVNDLPVGKRNTFGNIERNVVREVYPWRGVHSEAVNYNRYARIPIMEANRSLALVMEVRVFNDGVAFRYVIPRVGKNIVTADNTEFSMPKSSII